MSSTESLFQPREALLRQRDRSIGAILVDSGRLQPEAAEKILAHQKERGIRFGEAGLALGLISEEDVRYALANQFEYTYLPPGEGPVTSEVIAAYQPGHPCVEALRALRSQLMLRWLDSTAEFKSLALVSAEDGVGHSFVTANLAVVFSQLGERTLLIDANLRMPRMHELFKLENRVGLASILGDRTEGDPIIHIRAFAGLSVLPAGPIPPNPQELLSRPAFPELIKAATERYDVVLIDTPSWKQGADAQIIAARARAAILVTRTDYSSVHAAVEFVDLLGQSGTQVLGAVVNQF